MNETFTYERLFKSLLSAIGLLCGFSAICVGFVLGFIDGPRGLIKSRAFTAFDHYHSWPYVYGVPLILAGAVMVLSQISDMKTFYKTTAALICSYVYAFHITGFILGWSIFKTALYPVFYYIIPVFLNILYLVFTKMSTKDARHE